MGFSRTLIFSDQETLAKAVALYFAQAAQESIRERGRFLVALSGGESSLLLYQKLGSSPYKDYLPWDQIHVFWCDEKCLSPADEESHYSLAWRYWLKHISIPPENIHRIHAEKKQTEAVNDYLHQLRQFAGNGEDWPIFDWVLLHFGRNGQVASIYPGSDIISTNDEMVYSINIPSMGRLADRICLSPNLINDSRQVVIMTMGSDKAQALASTVKGHKDEICWPAQRIHPDEGLLIWMVDETATRYPSD